MRPITAACAATCTALHLHGFAANAQTLTTLYSFGSGTDGANPNTPFVEHDGILYGTTSAGGTTGNGTVYTFDPATKTETIIHNFAGTDGSAPLGGLVFSHKSIFGTANGGGQGYGLVFKIDIATNAESTFYTFSFNGPNYPQALTASGGHLFGTTDGGAGVEYGTVYDINIDNGTETLLHNFTGFSDGGFPGNIVYSDGLLYGVSFLSRTGYGYIFSLDPKTTLLTQLYNFTGGTNGTGPTGIVAGSNALYGVTTSAGSTVYGTVWRFDLKSGKQKTLYNFTGGTDGCRPVSAPIIQGHTLYGTTMPCEGGVVANGTVYAIDLKTENFTTVYAFSGGADGADPNGALLYHKGLLYGVTHGGGANQSGTIFSLKP